MINPSLLEIEEENTFSKASRLVREYREAHPEKDVLSLGIGDVSCPIVPPVIEAMHKAVDELSDMEHFSGYGSYYGIDSLRQTILDHEYSSFGFTRDEIFVSDGTKTDSTSILELFSPEAKVLVGDPMYPIYRNGALALLRRVYEAPLDENFVMEIPEEHYDIIYICSPSNPCGNAYSREDLQRWVDYALKEKAVIVYDNVYACFIQSDVPKSIYEIEGAKECAVELRSFSKVASFTGLRCSYYVLPKAIDTKYWKERTINRFNGASYIAQKGAEAVFLPESQRLIQENIRHYHENISYLRESFVELGYEVHGGIDAPYLWIRCPKDMGSWECFDWFLKEMDIIVVPGIIFGRRGDGHFRVSGLGTIQNSQKIMERLKRHEEGR